MEHLRTTEVVTRKEHECIGCLRKFPKGTKMQYNVFVDGREINADYMCGVCEKVYDNEYTHSEKQEGFYPGDIKQCDSWEKVREELED